MYEWLIFLHVAAVLAFMVAHGAHITAMWRMRAEADPAVSLTLLDAVPSMPPLRILLAVVVGSGVLAAFMGAWWSRGWIWTSLAVLAVIWLAMWRYAGAYYGSVLEAARQAIGAPSERRDRCSCSSRVRRSPQGVADRRHDGDRLRRRGGHPLADDVQAVLNRLDSHRAEAYRAGHS